METKIEDTRWYSTVEEENGRWRWTIWQDGKRPLTGTRKTQAYANQEVRSQIKFHDRQARRDRAWAQ